MNLKLKKFNAFTLIYSLLFGILVLSLKPEINATEIRLIPLLALLALSTSFSSSFFLNSSLLAILSITSFVVSYAYYHFSNDRLFFLLPIPLYFVAVIALRKVHFSAAIFYLVGTSQLVLITINDLRIRDRTLLISDLLYFSTIFLLLAWKHLLTRSTAHKLLKTIRLALRIVIAFLSSFGFVYTLLLYLLPFSADACYEFSKAWSDSSLYELPAYLDGSLFFRSCYSKILLPHFFKLSVPQLQLGDLSSGALTLSPHNTFLEYMISSNVPALAFLLFLLLSVYVYNISLSLCTVLLSVGQQSTPFVAGAALLYSLFSSYSLFCTYPLNLTRVFILFLSLFFSSSFVNLIKPVCARP